MKKCVQILFLFILVFRTILSQWSGNPTQNTPIKLSGGSQYHPQIINDSDYGAIICWMEIYDSENNFINHIFAQRLNSEGFIMWDSSGVSLNNGNGMSVLSKNNIISDMNGGAIIVWQDFTDSSIVAQHIDPSGQKLWGQTGILICEKEVPLSDPQIISDGVDGAIILWEERTSGAGVTGLYAHRINSNGQLLWSSNGVTLCTSPWFDPVQVFPQIISDGNDGAIIVWQDTRELADHIYAQRVNGDGSIIWPVEGLAINKSNTDKRPLDIINSIEGEFIITWRTNANTFQNMDIYSQKIDTSGVLLWNQNGIPICTAIGNQYDGGLVKSDNSSTIYVWRDRRRGVKDDFYGQKINSAGSILWSLNGILLFPQNDFIKYDPILITDNTNGAIFCWGDYRNGVNSDLYAQRLNSNGSIQWDSNGVSVSTAQSDQLSSTAAIISDKRNGTIITWSDNRTGLPKVYVQRIRGDGTLTNIQSLAQYAPNVFSLEQNYPNPFNPSTSIQYAVGSRHFVTLKIYDVLGREIATLVNEEKEPGIYRAEFNTQDYQLASGIYLYSLQAGNSVETKKMVLMK